MRGRRRRRWGRGRLQARCAIAPAEPSFSKVVVCWSYSLCTTRRLTSCLITAAHQTDYAPRPPLSCLYPGYLEVTGRYKVVAVPGTTFNMILSLAGNVQGWVERSLAAKADGVGGWQQQGSNGRPTGPPGGTAELRHRIGPHPAQRTDFSRAPIAPHCPSKQARGRGARRRRAQRGGAHYNAPPHAAHAPGAGPRGAAIEQHGQVRREQKCPMRAAVHLLLCLALQRAATPAHHHCPAPLATFTACLQKEGRRHHDLCLQHLWVGTACCGQTAPIDSCDKGVRPRLAGPS